MKQGINSLPSIGALVGVGLGVITKAGVLGTIILGIGLSGLGYYIQNKND